MTEKCTARIKNQHDDEQCVLEAGHVDPEYGTNHGGPKHPVTGRLRWNDSAVGAVPHQPSTPTATQATEVDTCRLVDVDGETVHIRGTKKLTEEGREALADVVRAAQAKFAAEAPEQVGVLQNLLREAHKARRAKEHQLDDIRRALCDAGFMEDNDPYSHADLADVIRQAGEHRAADALAAEWHRRHQRLEELTRSKGPEVQVAIVEHVRGELVGLRGALGVLLGGDVKGGTADLLGWAYYQGWRARQEPQA